MNIVNQSREKAPVIQASYPKASIEIFPSQPNLIALATAVPGSELSNPPKPVIAIRNSF